MNGDRLSKETFLMLLERLLSDIPKEERDEAMDYYRCYFEDAGAENEAAVLEELDSPQAVAASIREELNRAGNMTSFLKNPPQVRDSQPQAKAEYEYSSQSQGSGPDTGQGAGRGYSKAGPGAQAESGYRRAGAYAGYQKAGTGSNASAGAAYRRYDQYDAHRKNNKDARMDKRTKLILFIILAVFTSPVWGAAASGIFGVIGILVASVVLLGVCSVGGVVGGIVFAVAGIVRICMLSMGQGLSMLGVGMLMIAASGIGIVILLILCGRFLPWAAGRIAGLFRKLWNWGRSMA